MSAGHPTAPALLLALIKGAQELRSRHPQGTSTVLIRNPPAVSSRRFLGALHHVKDHRRRRPPQVRHPPSDSPQRLHIHILCIAEDPAHNVVGPRSDQDAALRTLKILICKTRINIDNTGHPPSLIELDLIVDRHPPPVTDLAYSGTGRRDPGGRQEEKTLRDIYPASALVRRRQEGSRQTSRGGRPLRSSVAVVGVKLPCREARRHSKGRHDSVLPSTAAMILPSAESSIMGTISGFFHPASAPSSRTRAAISLTSGSSRGSGAAP